MQSTLQLVFWVCLLALACAGDEGLHEVCHVTCDGALTEVVGWEARDGMVLLAAQRAPGQPCRSRATVEVDGHATRSLRVGETDEALGVTLVSVGDDVWTADVCVVDNEQRAW